MRHLIIYYRLLRSVQEASFQNLWFSRTYQTVAYYAECVPYQLQILCHKHEVDAAESQLGNAEEDSDDRAEKVK